MGICNFYLLLLLLEAGVRCMLMSRLTPSICLTTAYSLFTLYLQLQDFPISQYLNCSYLSSTKLGGKFVAWVSMVPRQNWSYTAFTKMSGYTMKVCESRRLVLLFYITVLVEINLYVSLLGWQYSASSMGISCVL